MIVTMIDGMEMNILLEKAEIIIIIIMIIIIIVLIIKKKRTCHLVDFAVPLDHRMKIKESENIDKYLDLARELPPPKKKKTKGKKQNKKL